MTHFLVASESLWDLSKMCVAQRPSLEMLGSRKLIRASPLSIALYTGEEFVSKSTSVDSKDCISL